jgi:outer membrane protein assembly factor BamE (lipoprotein component of BamABCDE complex)
MLRKIALAAAVVCALGVNACTPMMANNGFTAIDVKPTDIKVGEDTRSTVLTKLGSPTTQATFDPNTWYYLSQTTEKYAYYRPRPTKRDVVAISFDKDEKVASIKELTLKDGYQIAYDKRETPTRGRQMNWLEQLIGGIGRATTLPPENDPGSPRPH